MLNDNIPQIIEKLNMQEHTEGGWFLEVYRSNIELNHSALPEQYKSNRNLATSIYYAISSDNPSRFHRLNSDEFWHFHLGSQVNIHTITRQGEYKIIKLGNNILSGEQPFALIPAGVWFGATVSENDSYSLVGCTVVPGFEYEDFEKAKQEDLIKLFPQHSEIIKQLT
jgi:uncharacterized protein